MKPEQAFGINERCMNLVKVRCESYGINPQGNTHFHHIVNNLLNLTTMVSRIIEIDSNYWNKKQKEFLRYVSGLTTYLKLLDNYPEYLRHEITNKPFFPELPNTAVDYVTCSKIALENLLE